MFLLFMIFFYLKLAKEFRFLSILDQLFLVPVDNDVDSTARGYRHFRPRRLDVYRIQRSQLFVNAVASRL